MLIEAACLRQFVSPISVAVSAAFLIFGALLRLRQPEKALASPSRVMCRVVAEYRAFIVQ